MQWFEPIIIIAAISFVIGVIYFRFFRHRKKPQKHVCHCGCQCCANKCNCNK